MKSLRLSYNLVENLPLAIQISKSKKVVDMLESLVWTISKSSGYTSLPITCTISEHMLGVYI